MLCDLLTMKEASGKRWKDISYAYVGDARFNTGNSLLLVGAKMGMDVRIGAPKEYWPSQELIDMCREFAKASGAKITITDDPEAAVKGVDFIHTDIWVLDGRAQRSLGRTYRCASSISGQQETLEASGNPDVKFMHCLPAYHNMETKVGEAVIKAHPELAGGVEVTEEVFESPASIVFQQAGNRLHTIKAVLVSSLA